MLLPNLRPKVVPHGPRLLPGLIVRTRRRLVARAPSLLCAQEEARPSGPALRSRGHHPSDPRAVAPLQKREGFLALRFGTPACLLPEPVHPESVQPQGTSLGARVARSAAGFRRGALRAFGHLPSLGHDPGASHGPSEGFSQGASRKGLLARGFSVDRPPSAGALLRTEWIYGFKVALVVDPRGVVSAFFLAPASSDERPIGEALIASDRHEAYLADKGFTGIEWERRWMELYGALVAATPYDNSRRSWSKADRRWASIQASARSSRG